MTTLPAVGGSPAVGPRLSHGHSRPQQANCEYKRTAHPTLTLAPHPTPPKQPGAYAKKVWKRVLLAEATWPTTTGVVYALTGVMTLPVKEPARSTRVDGTRKYAASIFTPCVAAVYTPAAQQCAVRTNGLGSSWWPGAAPMRPAGPTAQETPITHRPAPIPTDLSPPTTPRTRFHRQTRHGDARRRHGGWSCDAHRVRRLR